MYLFHTFVALYDTYPVFKGRIFTPHLLILITSAIALFFFLSPLIISWPFGGAWPRNQNVCTNPFVYHWSQLLPVYHWSDKGGASTFSLGCVWEEVGHQEEIGERERSTGRGGWEHKWEQHEIHTTGAPHPYLNDISDHNTSVSLCRFTLLQVQVL